MTLDLSKLSLEQLLALRDDLREIAPKPHHGISDAKVEALSRLGHAYNAAMRDAVNARQSDDTSALIRARKRAEKLRVQIARGTFVRSSSSMANLAKNAASSASAFHQPGASSLGFGPDA